MSMTLSEVCELQPGDQIFIDEETMGANPAGVEIEYPAGMIGTVARFDYFGPSQGFGVEVSIGEGDDTIVNMWDEADECWPFRRVQ